MAKDNKNSVGKELSDKLSYVKKPLFESLDEDGVKKFSTIPRATNNFWTLPKPSATP